MRKGLKELLTSITWVNLLNETSEKFSHYVKFKITRSVSVYPLCSLNTDGHLRIHAWKTLHGWIVGRYKEIVPEINFRLNGYNVIRLIKMSYVTVSSIPFQKFVVKTYLFLAFSNIDSYPSYWVACHICKVCCNHRVDTKLTFVRVSKTWKPLPTT